MPKLIGSLILALFVAAPAVAQPPTPPADYWEFNNYCLVGSIRTCASIVVQTETDGNGGTNVTMWVRNDQGTNLADNTGGSIITAIGLTNPDIGTVTTWTPNPLVASDGASVPPGSTPASEWDFQVNSKGKWQGLGGQVTLNIGTQNIEGGILGCDPADGSPSAYYQTCGSGWVVFNFHTSERWFAENALPAWKVQSAAVDGESYECRIGEPDGDHPCQPETDVVPEPVTLVLLGTGLVGMGGVALRRRRRIYDVCDG